MPEVALTDPLALEQIVARQGEETIKIAARRDDDCADKDGCCVDCQFPLRSKSGSFATLAAMQRTSSPEGWNKAWAVAFSEKTSRGPFRV